MSRAEARIYYFDSSVILRYVANDSGAIKNLAKYGKGALTSAISYIECLRVLDRWRVTREVPDERLAPARSLCLKILDRLRIIAIDDGVVSLASQSFPIALKSLDAVHLASALQMRDQQNSRVAILTHDVKLRMAAVAVDLDVVEV